MEYLLDRIDRAEKSVDKLKKQYAPTVPQYDLSGNAALVFRATSDPGNSYLQSGGTPTYYMQFDVQIPSSTLALLAGLVYSANLFSVWTDIFTQSVDFPGTALYLQEEGGGNWSWQSYDSSSSVLVVPDTWHKINIEINGLTVVWTLNDTLLFTDSPRNVDTLSTFSVGATVASADQEVYYFDNLKQGTAPGTGSIIDFDFNDTDISHYNTFGNCAIVNDPLGTGGPDL